MDKLHSSTQPTIDENRLLPAIRTAVAQLRERFPEQNIPVLLWNSSFVAAPITVDVEIPGRGPVKGVDIRKREPILLLFDRKSFPYIAPRIYSNRLDFPKKTFPHINVTGPGVPAWFCLHRGSIDAWFAEHTVIDLVDRVRSWLRDAARNRLVPDGDGFEPTRAAKTLGTFHHTPEENITKVRDHWSAFAGANGHAVISFDLLDDEKMTEVGTSGYAVRQITVAPNDTYEDQKTLALAINVLVDKPQFKGLLQRRLFGLLIWAVESQVSTEHFGELPQTLGEFQIWAEHRGFPLEQAFTEYLSNDLQLFAGVPVILAIRRPQRILGTDSDIELLNFIVLAGGDHWPKEGAWNLAASVDLSDHRSPLTPDFARSLSALPSESVAEPFVVFGVGALGSKVTSHLIRSGSVAVRIVDHANISPHNIVRHALGGRAIGRSKAEALQDEMVKLYPGEESLPIEARKESVLACLQTPDFFDGYVNLIDMTASNVVFNVLRDANLPETIRVHRAEIADRGRLGFLSIEGPGRNPRLDDLQVMIFDSANEDSAISSWLNDVKSTRENRVGAGGMEDIQIGLSCSSATMRLADEVVSFHAAAVTRRLRPYLAKDGGLRQEGVIYRSFLSETGDSQAFTQTYAPTTILDAGFDWQVRIAATVAHEMSERMSQRRPSETGGILVGRINAPKKIVYVTRLIPAPPDSRGTPYVFTRGVERLPEALDRVHQRTGGLLTYVGEWHTHPMGGSELSDTDKQAVINLRSILDRAGLPTLVTIVTPDEIRAHLFEPSSPPLTVEPQKRGLIGILRATFGWKIH